MQTHSAFSSLQVSEAQKKSGITPFFQAKLRVNAPGDAHEQEADQVADQVMRMQEGEKPVVQRKSLTPVSSVQRMCADCEEKQEGKVQRQETTSGSSGGQTAPPVVGQVLSSGGGRPMETGTRQFMESRFGQDFGQVRIHTGGQAAESASAIQARAYTSGKDIVFGAGEYRPESGEGKKLLAHELVHVGQQGNKISRQISPEDVSGQMVGQTMQVTRDFNTGSFTVLAGSTVEIIQWQKNSTIAQVKQPIPSMNITPFNISKILLRPLPNSSGLARYGSGIDSTVKAIEKGDAKIAQEQARPGGPRPGELPRLQGLQQKRQFTLNRQMIQEVMYNRFDGFIKHWVDHYNLMFLSSRFGNLDSNLVKAMLFQETELGTSGQHMSLTPSHRVRGIYNLGQVIDSSAAALLIMMTELEPSLIATYHLKDITRETTQRPKGISAEEFMWTYIAPGQTQGFYDAVVDFFAMPGGIMRDTSYEFWIQTAVRWLFEKRKTVSSWPEAIRAYNGSGPRARSYRDAVTARSRDAQTDARQGRVHTPHR